MDGTRYDTVTGRFRDHNKADTVDMSDPLVNLILELNQVKKPAVADFPGLNLIEFHASIDANAQYIYLDKRKVVDKHGFELEHVWNEYSLQQNHDTNSSSYGGLEFRVSLLEIANRLCIDPDNVSRSLYILRKRNILSYTMSNSMTYMTVSKASLVADIETFTSAHENEFSVEKSIECEYNLWLRYVAKRVTSIVDSNLRCASTRVLDMWRVGNLVNVVAPAYEVHDQEGGLKGAADVSPFLSSMSADQRQKMLTDFVCDYYASELAPKKDHIERCNASRPSSSDSNLVLMEKMFYDIELPVHSLTNGDHDAESGRNIVIGEVRSRSHFGMMKLPLRQLEIFARDLRQLLVNPKLCQIVELLVCSLDAPSQADALPLKALYVAKIFHGFSSAFLNAQDWLPTGFWGRYTGLNFDCIVNAAKICCGNEVE